ncbi:MAG: endonuclease III domain-containing protein [Candidatus Edwardsbacteria bacterium]|jgi:endonuclease-3 related protein|nr:endonuclease III domain-containing protein [Candidatus Edwardsbacteria bacterium]
MRATTDLTGIYRILLERFGPQHWWPGDTPFEVMAGAILTQNTNWKNVELAIRNLKDAGLFEPHRIHVATTSRLSKLVRPSGFFNQKAEYLKSYCRYYVSRHGADVDRMRSAPVRRLREELLGLKGIGPETADSILLYALGRPVFVIDAYTRRVFSRHGVLGEYDAYEYWQRFFTERLPKHARLYNEYHALIVRLAKDHCRSKPDCSGCPLKDLKVVNVRKGVKVL